MGWVFLAFLAASSWAYDAKTLLTLPSKSLTVLRQEVTQLVEKKSAKEGSSYASFSKNGEWVLLRGREGNLRFKNLEGGFEIESYWDGASEPAPRKESAKREIFLSPQNLRVEAPLGWDWVMHPEGEMDASASRGRVKTVWFGSQGRWAISEGLDGSVKLWSLSGAREPQTLAASAILPDSREISMIPRVSFWQRLRSLFKKGDKPLSLRFATYTAGGNEVLALKDSYLRFRDIRSGESLKDSPRGASPMVYSGVYEPSREQLAVAASASTSIFSRLGY